VAGSHRLGWAALGFGLAALASSWNPVAAPFALATGLGAVVVAARALRRRQGGRAALAGLAAAAAGVAVSAVVLARTAGVGREEGAPLVPQPPPIEVKRALDGAAERSRPARERAARELDRLEKQAPSN
jgi:hypothetical protein